MAADERAQLFGHGQDDRTGGHREECLPPLCQPGVGGGVGARGTAAMAAGVVDIRRAATGVTGVQGPPQGLRAAGEAVRSGPTGAGPPRVATRVQGLAAVPPSDVRHLWPDGLQRAPRAARRALLAACTPAKAGGLRGGSRAGGPRAWVRREPPGPGPRARPIRPPHLQAARGQGPAAVMAPWALRTADQPAGGGARGDLLARAFRHAHTPGLEPAPAHGGLPVVDHPEPVPDLLTAQPHGEVLACPGAHTRDDRPRARQGALVKDAAAVAMQASR